MGWVSSLWRRTMSGDLSSERSKSSPRASAFDEHDLDETREAAPAIPCPRCSEPVDPTLECCPKCTGSLTIVQRFRIDACLGRGGMGVVYGAVDQVTGGRVAVKVQTLDGGWKNHELFERSSRVLMGLKHPGLPEVAAFEQDENGRGFLVREDFQGGTLEERILEQRHHLDPKQIRSLLVTLLGILDYLHTRQPPVLHRDIKASNIMFRSTEDWDPVLVDFDTIAAPKGRSDGLTIVGTPGYTSPEQLMGSAEPASDLFSLGATMLFVATHRSPDELPRGRGGRFEVESLLPNLEGSLRSVLSKMSEPSLDRRFESARQVLTELDRPLVVELSGAEKGWLEERSKPPTTEHTWVKETVGAGDPEWRSDYVDEEEPWGSSTSAAPAFAITAFVLILLGLLVGVLNDDSEEFIEAESSPGAVYVGGVAASFDQAPASIETGLTVEIEVRASGANAAQLDLQVRATCKAQRGLSELERTLRDLQAAGGTGSKDRLPEGPVTLVDSQPIDGGFMGMVSPSEEDITRTFETKTRLFRNLETMSYTHAIESCVVSVSKASGHSTYCIDSSMVVRPCDQAL